MIKNIYNDRSVVSHFQKKMTYNESTINQMAEWITKTYPETFISNNISILDIGIGNGIFSLPLLRTLKKHFNAKMNAYDISNEMLKSLDKNLNNNFYGKGLKHGDIRTEIYDAETGIPPDFKIKYNIIIATFIFHYLTDFNKILPEIYNSLHHNGLFIQGEIIGDFRAIDGNFEYSGNEAFKNFWQSYFSERENFCKWDASVKVTDINLIIDYFLSTYNDVSLTEQSFYWDTQLTLNEILNWIKFPLVSSLKIDLSNRQIRSLFGTMKKYLLNQPNSIASEPIDLKWGIKLHVIKKQN